MQINMKPLKKTWYPSPIPQHHRYWKSFKNSAENNLDFMSSFYFLSLFHFIHFNLSCIFYAVNHILFRCSDNKVGKSLDICILKFSKIYSINSENRMKNVSIPLLFSCMKLRQPTRSGSAEVERASWRGVWWGLLHSTGYILSSGVWWLVCCMWVRCRWDQS